MCNQRRRAFFCILNLFLKNLDANWQQINQSIKVRPLIKGDDSATQHHVPILGIHKKVAWLIKSTAAYFPQVLILAASLFLYI